MRRAVILGITGSIGTTALRGIRESGQVELAGYTYHSVKPEGYSCHSLHLDGNYAELRDFLANLQPDIVLNGIAGSAGLQASVACVDAGCNIALANKETVVLGGKLFLEYAAGKGVKIIPVDSEHSAIDELLKTNGVDNTSHLIITASGGPFLNTPVEELVKVTPETAVKHPTWKMGPKISVDSATLANKGLEIMEAHFLFGFPAENIEVLIHPQSVVHSMIRTKSGQVYAQMSPPDMVFPIMRALLDGKIEKPVGTGLDFSALDLNFRKPDFNKFPFLRDAFECVKKEGLYPVVFNIADEIAVQSFMNGRISFTQIHDTVGKALDMQWNKMPDSIHDMQSVIEEISRKIKI